MLRKLLLSVAAAVAFCSLSVQPAFAAYPGTNGLIAYASTSEAQQTTSIYTVNSNGSNNHLLVQFPKAQAVNSYLSPDVNSLAWSPDGTTLAFTRDRDVYTIRSDGSDLRKITNVPVDRHDIGYDGVTWTADGLRLISSQPEFWGVRFMNFDGGNNVNYMNGPILGLQAAPNGRDFVYWMSIPSYSTEIYVDNLALHNSSTQITHTSPTSSARFPDWRPDSAKIVFQLDEHVTTINSNGTGQASSGLLGWHPKYSPDGDKFAYLQRGSTDTNNPNYYRLGKVTIANTNGSGETNLVSSSEEMLSVDWQPVNNPFLYRMANWKTHERLFTTNKPEVFAAQQGNSGWVYENVAMHVYTTPGAGRTAVYRMANFMTKERLFTTDLNEVNAIKDKNGWVYENVAFYAGNSGTPIYRMANFKTKERLFTADNNEVQAIKDKNGWVYEGVAYYAPQ